MKNPKRILTTEERIDRAAAAHLREAKRRRATFYNSFAVTNEDGGSVASKTSRGWFETSVSPIGEISHYWET